MKVVRNSCPRVPEKRTGDRCSVKRSRDSGRDSGRVSGRVRFNGCCFEGYLQCLLVVTSDLYMSERRGGGGGEEESERKGGGGGRRGGGGGFRFRRGWRETEWRSGGGWRTRCMTWHMAYLRHRMTRT